MNYESADSMSLKDRSNTEEEKEISRTLAEYGILTERDFLLADDTTLRRSNIPISVHENGVQSMITRKALHKFCRTLIYSSIDPIQGDKLLESSAGPERTSTGFAQLDGILRGGLLVGAITEFAGPSNTMKTVVFPTIDVVEASCCRVLFCHI